MKNVWIGISPLYPAEEFIGETCYHFSTIRQSGMEKEMKK
jgi:hypothetical protein